MLFSFMLGYCDDTGLMYSSNCMKIAQLYLLWEKFKKFSALCNFETEDYK